MTSSPTHYFQTLAGEVARGWNRFWFTPSDPATLAVLRVAVGALALYLVASYTPDLDHYFGENGLLPVKLLNDLQASMNDDLQPVPPQVREAIPRQYRFSYLDLIHGSGALKIVHLAGLLVLAQRAQVSGEVVGRAQGVGVVITEHPAVADQGVLAELAGLLVLTQRAQASGEVMGQAQRVGVVITQRPAPADQGVLRRLLAPPAQLLARHPTSVPQRQSAAQGFNRPPRSPTRFSSRTQRPTVNQAGPSGDAG